MSSAGGWTCDCGAFVPYNIGHSHATTNMMTVEMFPDGRKGVVVPDRNRALEAEVERLRLALRHILAWADLQPSGWIDYIANECHQHLDGEPARALLAGEADP